MSVPSRPVSSAKSPPAWWWRLALLSINTIGIAGLVWLWHKKAYEHEVEQSLRNRSEHPEEGATCELTRGKVFYLLQGSENKGPLVVLVHGFMGCHKDFEPLAQHLIRAGRRVLRFDNYGRGWSSLAKNRADALPELFAGQLAELLFLLGETEPMDLVGYSMGGTIVAYFASSFPTKVNSLCLLTSAGMPCMKARLSPMTQHLVDFLAFLPGGQAALLFLVRLFVHDALKHENTGWTRSKSRHIHDWYASMYKQRIANEPGVSSAILATVQKYPFDSFARYFENVATEGIPTMAFWGKVDTQVPFESAAQMRSIFKKHQSAIYKERIFERAGHMIPIEAAEEVAYTLINDSG